MPQTKKILWIASAFLWLLPSWWQNPFFLPALGLLFNDTLKHVFKFHWHLKALLTLIGLKHLFMVNCVLPGLFSKEKKKRWIDLGMCLKLSRCLSALRSWGLRTESNPLWSLRMAFPCVPGAEEQVVKVIEWRQEKYLKEYFFSTAPSDGCQLLTPEL